MTRIRITSCSSPIDVPLTDFYFEVVPSDRTDPIPLRFFNELLGRGLTLANERFEPAIVTPHEYEALLQQLGAMNKLDLSQTEVPTWIEDADDWIAWRRVLQPDAIQAFREVRRLVLAMAAALDAREFDKLERLQEESFAANEVFARLQSRDLGVNEP